MLHVLVLILPWPMTLYKTDSFVFLIKIVETLIIKAMSYLYPKFLAQGMTVCQIQ
jgi:hypothetical protein